MSTSKRLMLRILEDRTQESEVRLHCNNKMF